MTVPHSIRAIVGARVSHVQGAEKVSHLVQQKTGMDYCAREQWAVVDTFEDLDVSALSTSPWERPDLGPWLTERPDEWDALVLAKTDRLFRSAKDCVEVAHWAEQNHKILVFVDDNLKLDFFTPAKDQDLWTQIMVRIFLILAAVFAEIEGRRAVQRAEDRVQFFRTSDRWGYGLPKFGFRTCPHPCGKGKALEHDPEAQTVLHTAAEWQWEFDTDGQIRSFSEVVEMMNSAGFLSPREHRRKQRGDALPAGKKPPDWTIPSYLKVMTSPATQGLKTDGGKIALDQEGKPVRVGPQSFSNEEWDRLQRAIQTRSNGPNTRSYGPHLMRGVGVCKNGHNLTRRTHHGVSTTYHYYSCGKTPNPCRTFSIKAEVAEEIVEESFLALRGDVHVRRRVWQAGEDHSYELDEVNRTIEGLRGDRALGLYNAPGDEEKYRGQMLALVARRTELSSRPTIAAGWVYELLPKTYAEMWAAADVGGRCQLLVDAGVTFVLSGNGAKDPDFKINVPTEFRYDAR